MTTIRLEPFIRNDFETLISWVKSEAEMYQFAGPVFTFPITMEQLEIYTAEPSRKAFKVIEEKSERVIGHCELGMIDLKNNKARVCRVIIGNDQDRGKGFGKSIIKALLHIAFNDLTLNRIDLGVFDFNKIAIRCYEQCGFQKEGLLRESFVMDGQYLSTYNMSILRREWKALE